MMTEAIIVAIITGSCAVISNLAITVTQASKNRYRIEQLEKKVEKHNNLVERVTQLEADERAMWNWIDEFKERLP